MVWNLVALEPDSQRWQFLRPVLGRLGHRAVAVQNVRAVESVVETFDVDAVLIRPVGSLQEHRRLAALLRKTKTRVFVTAEVRQPRILSLYYALGDQTRTVRPAPMELVSDMIRHADAQVDLLPPVPMFDHCDVAANEPSLLRLAETTEREPGQPQCRTDHVASDRLAFIQLPAVAVG